MEKSFESKNVWVRYTAYDGGKHTLFIFQPKEDETRDVIEVLDVDRPWDQLLQHEDVQLSPTDVTRFAIHLTANWAINVWLKPGTTDVIEGIRINYIDNGDPVDIKAPQNRENEQTDVRSEDMQYFANLIRSTGFARELRANMETIRNTELVQRFSEVFDRFFEAFANAETLPYGELFDINNDNLRMLAFRNTDIGEMIESLGYERMDVKGRPVKRLQFDEDGELIVNDAGQPIYKEYDSIYELLKVDIRKLVESSSRQQIRDESVDTHAYAVKVWCTSTKEPHYLFVEPEYAELHRESDGVDENGNPYKKGDVYYDAFVAIASTFRIQEDLVGEIEELHRQGDLMFAVYKGMREGKFDESRINSSKPKVALTPEIYFGSMLSET